MSVIRYDLSLNAKETREIFITVKDDNNNIIELTGVTVDAEIVDYIGETENVARFTATVIEPDGKIQLFLTLLEANKLQNFSDDGKHYWNVFFNYTGNKRKKRIDGNVKVKKAAV